MDSIRKFYPRSPWNGHGHGKNWTPSHPTRNCIFLPSTVWILMVSKHPKIFSISSCTWWLDGTLRVTGQWQASNCREAKGVGLKLVGTCWYGGATQPLGVLLNNKNNCSASSRKKKTSHLTTVVCCGGRYDSKRRTGFLRNALQKRVAGWSLKGHWGHTVPNMFSPSWIAG